VSADRRDRLAGVHPSLAADVCRWLDAMAAFGHPLFVCEGVRSAADQHAAFLRGASKVDAGSPGSTHERQPDGDGHAVDVAFQGASPWDMRHPWKVFGAMVKHDGYTWGGDWGWDFGHVEVKRG